jgi:hypothetical protein
MRLTKERRLNFPNCFPKQCSLSVKENYNNPEIANGNNLLNVYVSSGWLKKSENVLELLQYNINITDKMWTAFCD